MALLLKYLFFLILFPDENDVNWKKQIRDQINALSAQQQRLTQLITEQMESEDGGMGGGEEGRSREESRWWRVNHHNKGHDLKKDNKWKWGKQAEKEEKKQENEAAEEGEEEEEEDGEGDIVVTTFIFIF